ncbi:MAG TPA: hypothetical protein VGG27_20325 [Magnetospirillaceae bacterium]|jgi:hypothetical protein
MRKVLIAAFFGFAFGPLANAGSKDFSSSVVILSEGTTKCGQYTAEPEARAQRISWVLGYISGKNAASPVGERHAGQSFEHPETVDGWLQSYCGGHSLETLATAAESLRDDFMRHEKH